jgi:hypothetical protein
MDCRNQIPYGITRNPKKQVFLVVDGHTIQKVKLTKEFVDAQIGRLKLLYLQLYWPCLEQNKQVWAHVVRRAFRKPAKSKDAMKQLAFAA